MADNLLAFLWHIFSKVWRLRSYLPSKKTQTTNAKLPDTLVACNYVHRVRHFSVSSPHFVKNRKPRHHHIWGQRSMKYRSKLLYTLILSSAAQQTTHTPASHICFFCANHAREDGWGIEASNMVVWHEPNFYHLSSTEQYVTTFWFQFCFRQGIVHTQTHGMVCSVQLGWMKRLWKP